MTTFYEDSDLQQIAYELAAGIQDMVASLDHACAEGCDAYLIGQLEQTVATQADSLDGLVAECGPDSPWLPKFEAARARLVDARGYIQWIGANADDAAKQSYAGQAREQLEAGVQACQP